MKRTRTVRNKAKPKARGYPWLPPFEAAGRNDLRLFRFCLLGITLLYISGCGSEPITTIDSQVMLTSAMSLVKTGKLTAPSRFAEQRPNRVRFGQVSRNGEVYSKYTPGYPLVLALALQPAKAAGLMMGSLAADLVLCLPSILALLGTAVLLWRTCLRLGYTAPVAHLVAAGFAIGSFAWPYAGTNFSEPLQMLCVSAAFYGLLASSQEEAHWKLYTILAGVSLGYGILTKSSLGLMLPILACGSFWGWYKQLSLRQAIRRSALFAVSPSLAAIYLLSVNAYLFGDPQDFGYRGESFSISFQKGFVDLTMGLDKGILWFAPLVILAPAGVWKLRNHVVRWVGPVLALCSAAYLLLIACWYGYRGGNCWGPRLLMPVLPLLLLLAGAAMGGLLAKRVGVALLAAGFGVNLLGVLIYYQAYYTVAHSARNDIDWREPCFSQIPGHFWLLRVEWSKGGLNAPEEASPLWNRPTWISRYPDAIPPPYSHYEDPILNPWPLRLGLERPRLRRAEIWYLRALLEIAIMKYERSDLAGAMRLIQEGLEMDANHPPLVAAAGMIYYTAGQMEPALAQFNRAITLDPGYEMGWFGRGLVMEALKNPDAARRAYMRLLEMPLRTLDQAQIKELLARLQE